jgi:hypothetical protein
MHWAHRFAGLGQTEIDVGCPAMNPPESRKPSGAAVRVVTEHPVLTGIFAICVIGGAIVGAVLLTEDWSMARRLAAGAVAGAGVALLTTAPKIIG